MGTPPGTPPPPERVRPQQVVLVVGAVLVVSGSAALAGAHGGAPAQAALVLAGVLATVLSLRAQRVALRSTAETLAACGAVLVLAAATTAGAGGPAAGVLLPALVAAGCAALSPIARPTATWPLAAWAAGQLAALRVLPALPRPLHSALFLVVALAGLALALHARPLVARIALLTTAPWWVAGVVTGTRTAWTGGGLARQVAAALLVGAAAGLLALWWRKDLSSALRLRRAVPLLAGVVAGAAVSGSLSALGTGGVVAAGYVGVLTASTVPEYLPDRYREPLARVAVAGGSTMALLALVQLGAGRHWGALSLLLLLTAVPTLLVAWRRPAERPVAAPTALGCLTGSVLFALPAELLDPTTAAVVLTVLHAAGLTGAASLGAATRRGTLIAAGAAAGAAVVLEALLGDRTSLVLLLAGQGLVTTGWAWWSTGPRRAAPVAWRIGAAQLTVAAWVASASAGVHVLEAYTLPLAAGLLLATGPGLVRGRSWPAWGPALLVAAVPSAVAAVLEEGTARPVAVLLAAAAATLAGGVSGLRAPLLIGAWTSVGVGVGLAVTAALWPLAAALAVGAALLGAGARGERFPVAAFGAHLADLR